MCKCKIKIIKGGVTMRQFGIDSDDVLPAPAYAIEYCPLHRNAEKMRDMLEKLHDQYIHGAGSDEISKVFVDIGQLLKEVNDG